MLSVLLIILAAICNAAMDSVSHHFSSSIFRWKDEKFWNAQVSWQYAKMIGGYKFDAWHLFKTLMLFFLFAAVVHYKPISANLFTAMIPFAHQLIDWCLLGTIWNLTFNLFYNKILR